MTINNWKKEIWSIPNLLTLVRILLIPVYILIYLNAVEPSDYYIAGGILAVSCFTDLIDGKIARKYNMVTTLGKILDPFADKATQFALIVCLTVKYKILWAVLILFVIKESFQLIAGLINFNHGHILSKALFPGKVCTTVLFVSIIILVLWPQLDLNFVHIIAYIDLGFMTVAFANYVYTYCSYFLKNQAKNFEDL